jgi:hypothetical protein
MGHATKKPDFCFVARLLRFSTEFDQIDFFVMRNDNTNPRSITIISRWQLS